MSTELVKNISISNNSIYSSGYITIQFSISIMSKTVLFQIIQFSIGSNSLLA